MFVGTLCFVGALVLIAIAIVINVYNKPIPIYTAQTISVNRRGERYVFEKEGVYFSLTSEQLEEMNNLTKILIYREKSRG